MTILRASHCVACVRRTRHTTTAFQNSRPERPIVFLVLVFLFAFGSLPPPRAATILYDRGTAVACTHALSCTPAMFSALSISSSTIVWKETQNHSIRNSC